MHSWLFFYLLCFYERCKDDVTPKKGVSVRGKDITTPKNDATFGGRDIRQEYGGARPKINKSSQPPP